MTDNNIYAEWSVASVFNKNRLLRYDPNAAEQAELDWNNSPVSISRIATLGPCPDEMERVESVADCIRELGYIVKCNTASRASGKIEISSIYKLKWDPTSDSAWRKQIGYYGVGVGRLAHPRAGSRCLAGRRTIYEKANLGLFSELLESEEGVNKLRDISGEFTEQEIKTLIEDGSEANVQIDCLNQKSVWGEYDSERRPGVSTIGNTLPADIVQALQDFRSELPHFVREPDYEFYIPPSMQETPDACPPPEPANNLGGGAQAAAVAQAPAQAAAAPAQAPAQATAQATAVAAPASKKTSSTSDSSDSSDSDDDEPALETSLVGIFTLRRF
jgi:hypothetical protein